MRVMTWLTFLALLFINGVTQAQSATWFDDSCGGLRITEYVQRSSARVLRVVVRGY